MNLSVVLYFSRTFTCRNLLRGKIKLVYEQHGAKQYRWSSIKRSDTFNSSALLCKEFSTAKKKEIEPEWNLFNSKSNLFPSDKCSSHGFIKIF